ncbi:hypothetical protein BV898_08038 [Hypsibius exemplaris]|uniref:CABIT domain-containing protein n=1 Tax=Hypsibius exemplaris TaxID=2072580 RepID=A0A1W0WRT9_HYPEX|nr:hypothetical protein BV898_08038 [Hypsibius exemplaris]
MEKLLDWSGERLSVEEIRRTVTLPCIAKIDRQERVESDAKLDLDQPLLLFKSYKSVKVQARLLYRHKIKRRDVFQPYGDVSLVIPKGYTGLFATLDENGFPRAKRFMMINDLMKASGQIMSSFLIHNCVIQAYRRISERHYRRTALVSGTILRATGIFTDKSHPPPISRTSTARSTLKKSFAKLFFKENSNMYTIGSESGSIASGSLETFTEKSFLKCLNTFQEEFFIPLTTAGSFFLISDSTRTKEFNRDCIHLMSTLISQKQIPCHVKLICGYLPEMREHFSGYLQLESVQVCSVILACTMDQAPPYQLFEVDTTSEFEFQTATLENRLYLDHQFRAALAYAKAQSDTWRRQIKVAHEVTVDAEEEEHIYAEIGNGLAEEVSVLRLVESPQGGSTGGSMSFSSSGDGATTTTTDSGEAMTYRLSVLSHPSRISFA